MGRSDFDSPALRRVAYAMGLGFTVLAYVVAHGHDVWRPWLGGAVTEAFAEVLWVIDLSLGVQAIGYIVLMAFSTRFLRRLFELGNAVTGVISMWVTYRVYPFDLGVFDGPARIMLLVLLLLTGIGVLSSVVRTASAALSDE